LGGRASSDDKLVQNVGDDHAIDLGPLTPEGRGTDWYPQLKYRIPASLVVPASRALEGHEHARAAERGDQAKNARGAFLNPASCLRLARALCAEMIEAWLEDNRYINIVLLKERKKAAMKIAT
jgi:hypothetical protein